MTTKDEINVISGEYKVRVNRKLSKDKESIIAEVSLSDDLHDLLKEFACTKEKLVQTKIYNHDFKRYAVKKALKNSISWMQAMDLLFAKELMDKKKICLTFDDVNTSTDLTYKFRDSALALAEKAFALKVLDKGHESTVNLKPNY
jgi:hypothetical protein